MTVEKPPDEGQHWTAPEFISMETDKPPVGAWIDQDAVCRTCMKAAEEITMRRGFIDPISPEDAAEKEYTCTRCGNPISSGS